MSAETYEYVVMSALRELVGSSPSAGGEGTSPSSTSMKEVPPVRSWREMLGLPPVQEIRSLTGTSDGGVPLPPDPYAPLLKGRS